jgi:hypothetical protein
MDQMLLLRIRERAYEIWVASGGDAEENWLRAEAELLKNPNTGPLGRWRARRIRYGCSGRRDRHKKRI